MLAIDAYNVYWDAGYILEGEFVLLATINSYDHYFYEAVELTPGTFYSFQVSATNEIGEGELSDVVSHYAQSVPGKPLSPYRVFSEKISETTASITLAWYPLTETGGVPATGFKLYSIDEDEVTTLEFDGTDLPEILTTVVTDLALDKDYTFYITGLNPMEGEPSNSVSYRAAGRPTAVGAITEIAESRTGSRLGLQWEDSSSDGGSSILVYTLAQVQEN